MIIACFCLSACSFLKNSAPSNEEFKIFPMATAVQVDQQDENKLLLITQLILLHKKLTPRQKARLFYERGLIYDKIGLNEYSHFNILQSLKLDPSYAPSYNMLGLYLLQNHSYEGAFEAFDSAIELDKHMTLSYLYSAVGLLAIGRNDLAKSAIEKFYQADEQEPYDILWRFIINSNVDPKSALKNLKSEKNEKDNPLFIWKIIDYFAGRISQKDLINLSSKGIITNKHYAERLCELYFYLATWEREHGNRDKAIYYYKLSIATNVRDFIEFKYSYFALASIQQELMAEDKKKVSITTAILSKLSNINLDK